MGICGEDNRSSSDSVGDGTPGVGQVGGVVPEAPKPESGASGTEDRESQAPKGKTDSQNTYRPAFPGKSTFGRYQGLEPSSSFGKYKGLKPKVKVGYPCLNCEHTHLDHSYYEPRLCLFDEKCDCSGMKIDMKDIPSRMDR